MQCPKCLQIVPDGAVCPNCGAILPPAAQAEPPAASYCTACGAALAAGARFCPSCGASVSPAPAAAPSASTATPGASSASAASASTATPGAPSASAASTYTAAPAAPSAPAAPAGAEASPAISWLRGLLSSPLFMITAICYSVMAALSLYSGFFNLYPNTSGLEGPLKQLATATLVLSAIVPVCAAVGMWMQLAAARAPSSTMSTSGLTTMGASAVIGLVAEAIVFSELAEVLNQAIANEYYDAYYYYSASSIMGFVKNLVWVVLALLFVPTIVYRVKIAITTFGTARAVRNGGEPPVPSDYVGTLAMMWGAIYLLLLIFVLTPIQDMISDLGLGGQGIPTTVNLSILVIGVSNILLGVLVTKARSLWRRRATR